VTGDLAMACLVTGFITGWLVRSVFVMANAKQPARDPSPSSSLASWRHALATCQTDMTGRKSDH